MSEEFVTCPCCYAQLRTGLIKKHDKEGLTDVEARILIEELRKQITRCQKSLKRLSKNKEDDG